jgi:formate hydrogenlyase subunit 3/multisubunit Na+/H+ antiporter MnhD subunit
MIQTFFAVLFLILGLSFTVHSIFYEKKNLFFIIGLMVFSIISLLYWYISILVLILFVLYKKYDFGEFATLNMFTAVLMAWFFLNMFLLDLTFPFYLIAMSSLVLMSLLAIFGIFEQRLKKYMLMSNIIQILFVVLDLSVTKLLGKMGVLSTIQIFNYTFAGLTFFLTLWIFGRKKVLINELEGSYFASRANDIFATIACLSLAGLPAFNMFVSEWFLFVGSFVITPIITVLGIFLALLLFIMYYKIVYVLLVGEARQKSIPQPVTVVNGILALVCVILGLLPWLQLEILTRVII